MTAQEALERLVERKSRVHRPRLPEHHHEARQRALSAADRDLSKVASVHLSLISAAIYPHYHADHIGDIAKYVDAAKQRGVNLEIIAATKTKQLMDLAKSSFPRPTKELKWPHDSFQFEDLTVELHGFEWAAHCDDHSAWLLKQERIVHSPDLINPDQPPFWRFAGNERFRFHEDNLRQVYGLEWDYLSGSHGNIGSRADMDFQFAFIADLKAAVGKAMGAHPFSEFVNPKAKAHTEFLSKFFGTIATEATETLRPKYGEMYGFDEATPPNAEMVAWAMFEYR